MSVERHQSGWVIVTSFVLALMLSIVPLPVWAVEWRPDWVAMVLIYWCIATPQRVSVATGWTVGLVQDVLSNVLLGQHALSLSIVAYFSVQMHRQVRIFPVWQQAMFVALLIVGSRFPELWIRGMLNYPSVGWAFALPAVTSLILWPWLFILLRDLRRYYRVM
jgi:rod shape-determining protein MreD